MRSSSRTTGPAWTGGPSHLLPVGATGKRQHPGPSRPAWSPARQLHLRVGDQSVIFGQPEPLRKAEDLGQPVQGASHVFVRQITGSPRMAHCWASTMLRPPLRLLAKRVAAVACLAGARARAVFSAVVAAVLLSSRDLALAPFMSALVHVHPLLPVEHHVPAEGSGQSPPTAVSPLC
jgi:hypothetical protein